MKKIILCALSLALVFTLLSLAACDNGTNVSGGVSSQESAGETSQDGIPHLGERDLGGFTLEFVSYDRALDKDQEAAALIYAQYDTNELNNEPVNDAMCERNWKIESDYNCVITRSVIPNVLAYNVAPVLQNQISAETNTFNVISGALIYSSALSTAGMLTDFNSIEDSNLSLESDWWDKDLSEQCSINHKLDFITGELVTTDNGGLSAVYFNRDMIAQLGLESPYALVDSGDWTYDKMIEMAKAGGSEDGDGERTVTKDDKWGMLLTYQDLMGIMNGFGLTITDKDANDLPIITASDENYISVYNKIYEDTMDFSSIGYDRFFYTWDDPDLALVGNNFPEQKALFALNVLSFTGNQNMRNSSVNYGIVPYPKYNKDQERYLSPISVYSEGYLSIPCTEAETDEITFILEAMSYLSKQTVTPAYYEMTLKYKRLTDDDSMRMLDIISASRTYDLSIIYEWGGIYYENSFNIEAKVNTFTSRLQAVSGKAEQAMNETVEMFLNRE